MLPLALKPGKSNCVTAFFQYLGNPHRWRNIAPSIPGDKQKVRHHFSLFNIFLRTGLAICLVVFTISIQTIYAKING